VIYLFIDLHVHTKPKSPCSNLSPREAIEEARRIGLNAICLMEHDVLWSDEEIAELKRKYNFLVLKGYEISSLDGHFLAYGFTTLVPPFLELKEIRERFQTEDGFLAIAHPFREFLVVGISEFGLQVEEEAKKEIFQMLDGIEILNGRVSKKANIFAKKVNQLLKLKAIGGSDAHELYEIGKVVTEFDADDIQNAKDLVRELKSGKYHITRYREE